MKPRTHSPQILPMSDMTDEWVVRCDCGCGLFEQYAQREEAEARADAALDDGATPTAAEHGVDHTDVLSRGPEPI